MFRLASPPSLLAFLLVCGVVLAVFLRGIWVGAKFDGRDPIPRTLGVAVGLALWLGLLAGVVASGWLEAAPGRLLVFGPGILLVSTAAGFSRIGEWLARPEWIPWLLAFQGFRLPLELVLHAWAGQGVIPGTMTWTGANWDVLSGLAALGLAPCCRRSRAAAWVGNIVGFVLLVNVGRVAVWSAPVPFGWPDVTPKLLLPFHLPYALILPVCVGGALIGHIVLTRALLRASAVNWCDAAHAPTVRLSAEKNSAPVTDFENQAGAASATRGNRLSLYFKSGWAFLIPYLAAYLLYAWLRWPVNASPASHRPSLLHVYWFLHAAHLLLGGVALLGGWQNSTTQHAPDAVPVVPGSYWQKAVPWICLALLFYIPGVYLEFPADPWQHYTRVNEWSWLQAVTEHPFWTKSSYFLAYSVVGKIAPPVLQLRAFDVFNVGCCLLLCWQYYRLARALRLGPGPAMLFVLLQALLSGNFLFGFYRYYGISSSLFAQLGAVALVRVALEVFDQNPAIDGDGPRRKSILAWGRDFLVPGMLLVVLIALNHIQGLGIAGLGVAAIAVWRLVRWRRQAAWWLAGAVVFLSVTVIFWWPRHPALDASYRPDGWLNAWYGFNFLSLSSPAYERVAAILGLFGLLNLFAGLVLLRRNEVVGWLTVLPVVALCLPCVAIPFANSLAARPVSSGEDIIVFSRMLFAIPCGLAVVALLAGWQERFSKWGEWFMLTGRESAGRERLPRARPHSSGVRARTVATAALPLGLLALTVIPPGGPSFNRLFNALMVPPDDLAMRHVLQSPVVVALAPKPRLPGLIDHPEQTFLKRGAILTTPGIGYVMNATGSTLIDGTSRRLIAAGAPPPSVTTPSDRDRLTHGFPNRVQEAAFPVVANLFSPVSQTGFLSTHWLPQEVALVHATQNELFAPRAMSTAPATPPEFWLEWSGSRSRQTFSSKEDRVTTGLTVPNDGVRLNSGTGEPRIQAGDRLNLRPVMKTPGGNGWVLGLQVRGPGFASQREFFGRPSPLGRPNEIVGNDEIRVLQPGEYTVELSGKLFWPAQTLMVRYHFTVQPAPR
jgi:hypothetical protein